MFGGRDVHALNLAALRQAVTIIPQVVRASCLPPPATAHRREPTARASRRHAPAEPGRVRRARRRDAAQRTARRGARGPARARRARGRGRVVLDEATSAVDGAADAAVRDAVPPGVTVLVVAHRLASVVECDRIVRARVLWQRRVLMRGADGAG
jgi:hypothetical protein